MLNSSQTDSKGGPGHSFLGASAAAAVLNSCARLEMQNLWVPDGETIVADDLYQFNLACRQCSVRTILYAPEATINVVRMFDNLQANH